MKQFGNKKEIDIDNCYIMNEPWKYCVQWKQPVTEYHKLYKSIYVKYL